MKELIHAEVIEKKIYLIHGHRVMLDSDLAGIYGVATKVLLQAVKRNSKRFPPDFMFQLNYQDVAALRSQIVTLKKGRGQHRKYPHYVFTEQGVAMLSSVLNSERAVEVNIQIMRTFIKIREMLTTHKDLKQKIGEMEKKYDSQFKVVFEAIRQLLEQPKKQRKRIGFLREKEK
jgi:phage regulator Rha-like protein